MSRLEKAGGPAVAEAHRLLRVLEDLRRDATRPAVEVRNSFAVADRKTVGHLAAVASAAGS